MDESILVTIKKMLGIIPEDNAFDTDIKVFINTAINHLFQLGIGQESFVVEDGSELWSDYISDIEKYESVKSYIYIKTRLLFDPPSTSFTTDALNKQLSEIEFRLLVQGDEKNQNEEG